MSHIRDQHAAFYNVQSGRWLTSWDHGIPQQISGHTLPTLERTSEPAVHHADTPSPQFVELGSGSASSIWVRTKEYSQDDVRDVQNTYCNFQVSYCRWNSNEANEEAEVAAPPGITATTNFENVLTFF